MTVFLLGAVSGVGERLRKRGRLNRRCDGEGFGLYPTRPTLTAGSLPEESQGRPRPQCARWVPWCNASGHGAGLQKSQNIMRVHVWTHKHKVQVVEIAESATVSAIHQAINKIGIPKDRRVLLFNGTVLDDDNCLVSEGVTLRLLKRATACNTQLVHVTLPPIDGGVLTIEGNDKLGALRLVVSGAINSGDVVQVMILGVTADQIAQAMLSLNPPARPRLLQRALPATLPATLPVVTFWADCDGHVVRIDGPRATSSVPQFASIKVRAGATAAELDAGILTAQLAVQPAHALARNCCVKHIKHPLPFLSQLNTEGDWCEHKQGADLLNAIKASSELPVGQCAFSFAMGQLLNHAATYATQMHTVDMQGRPIPWHLDLWVRDGDGCAVGLPLPQTPAALRDLAKAVEMCVAGLFPSPAVTIELTQYTLSPATTADLLLDCNGDVAVITLEQAQSLFRLSKANTGKSLPSVPVGVVPYNVPEVGLRLPCLRLGGRCRQRHVAFVWPCCAAEGVLHGQRRALSGR
eukprot:m.144939 g.144939  ORF g.144939 m.144939 type:complete len:522 (-) comp17210_c0_seq1:2470-4035(-)